MSGADTGSAACSARAGRAAGRGAGGDARGGVSQGCQRCFHGVLSERAQRSHLAPFHTSQSKKARQHVHLDDNAA